MYVAELDTEDHQSPFRTLWTILHLCSRTEAIHGTYSRGWVAVPLASTLSSALERGA